MTPFDLFLHLLAVAASLPILALSATVSALLILAAIGWARRGAPSTEDKR